jgi:hypothetical protein
MSTSSPDVPAWDASRSWSRPIRWLVSVLVIYHLAAVLMGPLSVPEALIPSALAPVFRPYHSAAYLNHGYKFFAPDPGPSHLIRYDVELADGSHRRGEFPNLAEERPRLLYHRYFMLTEFIGNAPPPPDWDPRLDWKQQPLWAWQRDYAQSYADHLLARYGGKRVTLDLVEHGLPGPEEVLEGAKLDDPRGYRSRPLGTFEGGAP